MGLGKETGALQQNGQRFTCLVDIRGGERGTGDQQQVGPGNCYRDKATHRRPQQALGPVAFDRIPDRQPGAHPNVRFGRIRFEHI